MPNWRTSRCSAPGASVPETELRFRRLEDDTELAVAFSFDDVAMYGRRGESLAAALLAAGVRITRLSAVDDSPRAPYCMMGACYECLVTVDDVPNVQACMVALRAGMRVRTMRGAADAMRQRGHEPEPDPR